MNDLSIMIYTSGMEIPELGGSDFFHSTELFHIYERTPRHSPLMAVAKYADGREAGHMLAVVRRRSSWLPPFLTWHCRIEGEGEYADRSESSEVFDRLVEELMRKMPVRVLYVEFSHLSTKMFGYKTLRRFGFFPVSWLNIHNSLHSKSPEERVNKKLLKRVTASQEKGVETHAVADEEEFKDFMRLLKAHNYTKLKRYIPDTVFFREVWKSGYGKLYVTKYHNTVIGCCAIAVSKNNAFLWYAAFKRKSYHWLHPAEVTIWNVIKEAYSDGYDHFCFLDVGLPYSKNKYRDMIMKYGGKQVSAFRWFVTRTGWLNSLLSRIWSL